MKTQDRVAYVTEQHFGGKKISISDMRADWLMKVPIRCLFLSIKGVPSLMAVWKKKRQSAHLCVGLGADYVLKEKET